ncbi:hypothetical protein Tco_0959809 [Tanacetum coccineum]
MINTPYSIDLNTPHRSVEGLMLDLGYSSLLQKIALKIDGYAVLIEVNTAYRDTAFVDRRIRRIGNYTYAFSCEVQALIRRIFFVGYGISLLTREKRYFRSMASSYEREAVYARQAWSHSEDRSMALEALIRA